MSFEVNRRLAARRPPLASDAAIDSVTEVAHRLALFAGSL